MSEHNQPHEPESSLSKALIASAGMGADEHETSPPGAEAISVKAGHEPDHFGVKAILYVPLLVTGTVITAIVIITVIFNTMVIRQDRPNPNADLTRNPLASANANADLNDRFARISSTDYNAEIKQPRLEYLKLTDNSKPTDPPYVRSKRPLDVPENSYEIRPEDLRPENFIDRKYRRKILIEYAYQDEDRKLASIPIDEAIKLVVANNKLPTSKDAKPAVLVSDEKAKLSNAGRGGPSMAKSTIDAELNNGAQ